MTMSSPEIPSPHPDQLPDDIPKDARIFEISAKDPIVARIDTMFSTAYEHPGTVLHIRNGREEVYLTAAELQEICIKQPDVFAEMEKADAGGEFPVAANFDTKRVQLLKKAKSQIHEDSDSGHLAA